MDDRSLMRSLKAAFPDGKQDTYRDWAELAGTSRRLAEREAVVRGRRQIAGATAGLTTAMLLVTVWWFGGSTEWNHRSVEQLADRRAVEIEQSALQEKLIDLQRQASDQQALIQMTVARVRTASLQEELSAITTDESTFEAMLAEARAASWLLADAERRAQRDAPDGPTEARRLYEQVVRVYPGTPAAERAADRLAQHARGRL